MKIHGLSHVGSVRENNEDRFLLRKLTDSASLLAVADGMGGQAGGEVAAQLMIDILAECAPPSDEKKLAALISKAHQAIRAAAAMDQALKGMGTTATLALVDAAAVYWAHVGDSRLYHFRAGILKQVTSDQNLAGVMIGRGELTPEQARCSPLSDILLQCAGGDECLCITGRFATGPGELLLLCTDGFSGPLPRQRITALLANRQNVKQLAESLVAAALQAGGTDNITVLLAAT